MVRSCKHINISDTQTVLPWITECTEKHKKRYDFKHMLIHTGVSGEDYRRAISGEYSLLSDAEEKIAEEAVKEIRNRELKLRPVSMRLKKDNSSLKVRYIGLESPMQQEFDYIAVKGAEEVWKRRMIPQQASSVKNRGQTYGVNTICKWIQKDCSAAEYAVRHGMRYSRKCRYFVHMDIRKCYQSMRKETFLRLFRKDCANEDLIWLWDRLLESHKIVLPDGTKYQGFMIGALPSQTAAQYMLSFIYRYAMSVHRERRGRKIKSVSHMLMWMDDMILFGPDRGDLKRAAKLVCSYTRTELGLAINPGWQICRREDTPVDMMGYRINARGKVTVRPRVFLRARRLALRVLRKQRVSFLQARRLCAYKGYFMSTKRTAKRYRYVAGAMACYGIMRRLHLHYIFYQSAGKISNHAKYGNQRKEKVRRVDDYYELRGTGVNPVYAVT